MRGKKIKKRIISPDSVYNNVLVSQFINQVMRRGEKNMARRIVYQTFNIIKEKTQKEPLEVFEKAIENVSPALEVRPKRIGGATYQVPVEVKGERRIALSLRWIIQAAKMRKGKLMKDKLAEEIINSANNTGWAVKKKEDTQKMAEANRAFAHFSW